MGKEVLAIPEEFLQQVVQVIRRGIEEVDDLDDEVREQLERWCDRMADDED
jgi:hypothetical protein